MSSAFVFNEKNGLWINKRMVLEEVLLEKNLRLFLDTNILLNAFAFQSSRSSAIVESCRSKMNKGIISTSIVEEAKNIILSKCPNYVLNFSKWLDCSGLEIVDPVEEANYPTFVFNIKDQDDRGHAATAIFHNVDFLVTNDDDYLPATWNGSLKLKSPASLIEWATWMPSPTKPLLGGFTIFANILKQGVGRYNSYIWDMGNTGLYIEAETGKLVGYIKTSRYIQEVKTGKGIPNNIRFTSSYSMSVNKGIRVSFYTKSGLMNYEFSNIKPLIKDYYQSNGKRLQIGNSVSGEDALDGGIGNIKIWPFFCDNRKIESLLAFGEIAFEEYELDLHDINERVLIIPESKRMLVLARYTNELQNKRTL